MKNVSKFLLFLLYTTIIFFLPNNQWIFIPVVINGIGMVLTRKTIGKTIYRTIKIFPFILFTFVINGILDNWVNALWIGVKLILVCNITVVYANTTSVMRSCRNDPIIVHTFETIKHSTRRDKNNGMYVFIDDSNF